MAPLGGVEDLASLVPQEVTANLARMGWGALTPVQRHAIPLALAGRDLICSAQTGSGKTGAFTVPIIAALLGERGASRPWLEKAPPRFIIKV